MTTGDYSEEFYQLYDDLDIIYIYQITEQTAVHSCTELDNSKHAQNDVLSLSAADDQLECVETDNEGISSYTVRTVGHTT
jgi:hypothetical protein